MVPPPVWWLEEMRRFDDRLVIFPSQHRMTFVLARRATKSAGETLHTVKGVSQNPDTLIMASHRLVRVCEILPGVIWDQRVFQKLAAHDIQRLGGPTAVADRLDAMDAKRDADIQKAQDDEVSQRAKAGYLAYKSRIGERISLAKTQGRGTLKTQPVSVSVRQPSTPPAPTIVLAT